MNIPEKDLKRLIELVAEIDTHLATAKDKRFNSTLKDMRDKFVELIQKQIGGKECD